MPQVVSAEEFALESAQAGTFANRMMQNIQTNRIINREISIHTIIMQIIKQQLEEKREQHINLITLEALRSKLENELIRAEERYIKNQVEKTQEAIQNNIQNMQPENVIAYLNEVIDKLTKEKEELDKEMEPYKQEVEQHDKACQAVDEIVDEAYNDQEAQDDMRRRYEADLNNQGITDPAVIKEKVDQFNTRLKNTHVDLKGIKRLLGPGVEVNPNILILSSILKKTQAAFKNPEKAMQVNPVSVFGDKLYEKRDEVAKRTATVDVTYVPVVKHAEKLQSLQFSSNTISAMIEKTSGIRDACDKQETYNPDWE